LHPLGGQLLAAVQVGLETLALAFPDCLARRHAGLPAFQESLQVGRVALLLAEPLLDRDDGLLAAAEVVFALGQGTRDGFHFQGDGIAIVLPGVLGLNQTLALLGQMKTLVGHFGEQAFQGRELYRGWFRRCDCQCGQSDRRWDRDGRIGPVARRRGVTIACCAGAHFNDRGFEAADFLLLVEHLAAVVAHPVVQAFDLLLQVVAGFAPAMLLGGELAFGVGQGDLTLVKRGALLGEERTLFDLPGGFLALGGVEIGPVGLELALAQFHLARMRESLLGEALALLSQLRTLFFQVVLDIDQLTLTGLEGRALGSPVAMPALLQAATQLREAFAVGVHLLAAVGQLAMSQVQIATGLGSLRFMLGAFGTEGFVRDLRLLAQLIQAAALLFEVSRELFLLLLEGGAPLQQAGFFLIQGGLLGGHGSGLRAQGLALLLRPRQRFGGLSGGERHVDANLKLERAHGESGTVGQRTILGRLAIDLRACRAGKEAQQHALGTADQEAVQRGNALDIQAEVAAGSAAKQGRGVRQGAPGPLQAAVVHDEFRRSRCGAGMARQVVNRFHPHDPRRRAHQDSPFIDCAGGESSTIMSGGHQAADGAAGKTSTGAAS